jgi:hypothetical protein
MRVIEIGGGLSGFQFALSKMGCDVVNIDLGMEAAGLDWAGPAMRKRSRE